jgi:hypothetical protein
MQIAGNRCRICGLDVILSREGKFCAKCETVVHVACEPRSACPDCGGRYSDDQPVKVDPRADAFVPHALRPVNSGVAILLLAAVLAFMIFGLYLLFIEGLSHGH